MEKYITLEEFKEYSGIDLEIELQDDDNKSNKVRRFIHEITDWCVEHLILEYGCNELLSFQTLKEFRQDYFRKGVMEQMEYVLDEGNIYKASGFNGDTDIVVNLTGLEMSKSAFQKFRMGAFCNIERY